MPVRTKLKRNRAVETGVDSAFTSSGRTCEKHAFNDIIGTTNRVVHYQMPSYGIAGAPLTVRHFFDLARSANYQSRILDAKEDLLITEHADGDPEQKRRFMLAIGQVGSYLEAGIYDQAFLAAV